MSKPACWCPSEQPLWPGQASCLLLPDLALRHHQVNGGLCVFPPTCCFSDQGMLFAKEILLFCFACHQEQPIYSCEAWPAEINECKMAGLAWDMCCNEDLYWFSLSLLMWVKVLMCFSHRWPSGLCDSTWHWFSSIQWEQGCTLRIQRRAVRVSKTLKHLMVKEPQSSARFIQCAADTWAPSPSTYKESSGRTTEGPSGYQKNVWFTWCDHLCLELPEVRWSVHGLS